MQDIKPENIMLSDKGESFIADFGLSRLMEGTRLSHKSVVGTYQFMAPEMFDDDQPHTFALDVWSAGCVVFETLTGKAFLQGFAPAVCTVWLFQS